MERIFLHKYEHCFTVAVFLQKLGFSLTQRRKLKKQADFYIDGKIATANSIIKSGQYLKIITLDTINVIAQQKNLQIVFEDEYILVINKPHDLMVHPTVKQQTDTLANYLCAFMQNRTDFDGIHFVSRLDKDTSGLILIAKTSHIKHLLSKNKIHKSYLALLSRQVPAEQGMVDLPIARKCNSVIEREISINGKTALTYYKKVSTYKNGVCLVKLQAITGRTHQLRVHMLALGCPILGDSLYLGSKEKTRHFLHASKLVFKHPITEKILCLKCKLPEDMLKIILTN